MAIFKPGAIHIYSRSTGTFLQPLQGLGDSYISPTFSPVRPHLAFGFNKEIQVWSLDNQKVVQTFRGHSDIVHTISFSPDGAYIASSSDDRTCRLWSMSASTELACFSLEASSEVYFSEDVKYIVARRYGNEETKYLIPQEFRPDGARDGLLQCGPSKIANDGWLYSGRPQRRVCWIPANLRSYRKMWTQNGCILWVTKEGEDGVHFETHDLKTSVYHFSIDAAGLPISVRMACARLF